MKKKDKNRLNKLLKSMPNYEDIGNEDLKTMIVELILDQTDDELESTRGTRSRIKLDALKVLADVVKSENGGDITNAVLSIITDDDE